MNVLVKKYDENAVFEVRVIHSSTFHLKMTYALRKDLLNDQLYNYQFKSKKSRWIWVGWSYFFSRTVQAAEGGIAGINQYVYIRQGKLLAVIVIPCITGVTLYWVYVTILSAFTTRPENGPF